MALETFDDDDEFGGIDPAGLTGLPGPTAFLDHLRRTGYAWIHDIGPGRPFPLATFLQQRVLYYPGGGNDFDPLRLFYKRAGTRCFVYADYMKEQEIADVPDFQLRAQGEIMPQDLGVHDWEAFWPEPPESRSFAAPADASGLWRVLDPHTGSNKPIVLLYLKTEAIHTYYVLWARHNAAPDAIVLQDHGFGGNWDKFGAGGLLYQYATEHGLPRLLYVARNTYPWPGFEACSDFGEGEGQHGHRRAIFSRA